MRFGTPSATLKHESAASVIGHPHRALSYSSILEAEYVPIQNTSCKLLACKTFPRVSGPACLPEGVFNSGVVPMALRHKLNSGKGFELSEAVCGCPRFDMSQAVVRRPSMVRTKNDSSETSAGHLRRGHRYAPHSSFITYSDISLYISFIKHRVVGAGPRLRDFAKAVQGIPYPPKRQVAGTVPLDEGSSARGAAG